MTLLTKGLLRDGIFFPWAQQLVLQSYWARPKKRTQSSVAMKRPIIS
jgi:hypothetical protein